MSSSIVQRQGFERFGTMTTWDRHPANRDHRRRTRSPSAGPSRGEASGLCAPKTPAGRYGVCRVDSCSNSKYTSTRSPDAWAVAENNKSLCWSASASSTQLPDSSFSLQRRSVARRDVLDRKHVLQLRRGVLRLLEHRPKQGVMRRLRHGRYHRPEHPPSRSGVPARSLPARGPQPVVTPFADNRSHVIPPQAPAFRESDQLAC